MGKKRRPEWAIDLLPPARRQYDFFLSHVREDKRSIVELKAAIRRSSKRDGPPLSCFIDRDNWESWNDLTTVLRYVLLRSRHMIVWVTPAYLNNNRGWVWMELAYAELLERNLSIGELDSYPFVVPIFSGVTSPQLERTPLFPYWQRRFEQAGAELPIPHVAKQLVEFHRREERKRGPERLS